MKLVIVTGMSGAGKTTALKILEDVGFYCVDNLPIRLIEKFAELVLSGADGRREVALGIDVRSGEELPLLKNILEGWRKQELPFSILFLDSSDEVLIKRYKETRRSHPLARSGRVEKGIALDGSVDGWSQEQMTAFIEEHQIPCPTCGKHNFTDIRQFNLMFKTFQGVTEDAKNTVYLRPETAQGIFVNFKNVQRTSRKKLPFGIAQIGKSFRNEITPGNFTFRTREFEQMELEFFCKPDTDLEWFDYWKSFCLNWLSSLGLKDDEVRYRDHDKEELSFYSKATTDVEFLFPFGWGELWGIADRTDYDLTQHQNVSGQDLTYFDDETKEKYIPYVIEPSLGADRMVLAFLCSAYDEENIGTEEKPDMRTVLHFHPALAPVKIGVLPLSKKLNEGAEKIYTELCKYYNCEFDDRGNIGKRYRRQDEIGTPFCVTYDFESEEDGAVTVRDRDTMEQERIKIEDLKAYFEKKFEW